MMGLADYKHGSGRKKSVNKSKSLSKALQLRNRAEIALQRALKSNYCLNGQQRNNIVDMLADYYSKIPFEALVWNKYQVKNCVIESIMTLNQNFNPYSARKAYELIEAMLTYLITLPWHVEFRRICTYSGTFKTYINAPLVEAESILMAAGYEKIPGQPMQYTIPDNKMPQVDQTESVISVILDCLLAQVIMTNLIEVFEACYTLSNQPSELRPACPVNCDSWIKSYMKERSLDAPDINNDAINLILNNLTNSIARIDLDAKSNADTSWPQARKL